MDEDRVPLIAKKGYIYTNGKDTYGIVIYVEVGKDDKEYYQITLEEYEEIMASIPNDDSIAEDEATEEDYIAALNKLGVEL